MPDSSASAAPYAESAAILNEAFFTLEYDPASASFIRRIPLGAEDMGGVFRWKGRLLKLPEDGAPLKQKTIRGKALLNVCKCLGHILKNAPLPAERGERLMELCAPSAAIKVRTAQDGYDKGGGSRPEVRVIFNGEIIPRGEWLPLADLPNHRFCRNRIYEIIGDENLSRIFDRPFLDGKETGSNGVYGSGRDAGERPFRILRDAEIPEFADTFARLIYLFADPGLYRQLSQDAVFVDEEKAELVLRCFSVMHRGVGKPWAAPVLKYEKQRYSAAELSRCFEQRYIPLDGRWIRRRTLEKLGIGPLGRFAGGSPIGNFRLSAEDILSGSCKYRQGPWTGFEFEKTFRNPGMDRTASHLEFLRAYSMHGGVITHDDGGSAPHIASWLAVLKTEIGKGRAVVLVERDYFFERLYGALIARKLLGSPVQEGLRQKASIHLNGYGEAELSVFDPLFQGIGIVFYDEFLLTTGTVKTSCDILVLVNPCLTAENDGTVLETELLKKIRTVAARLKLGIFFDQASVYAGGIHADSRTSLTPAVRDLFGLYGKLIPFEKYLLRDITRNEEPPFPAMTPRKKLRIPPKPFAGEDAEADNTVLLPQAFFKIEAKFKKIKSPEFAEEQQFFYYNGKAAPFIPLETGTPLYFGGLSDEQRLWFFFWRREFRRGNILKTGYAYILLYARELILCIGNGNAEDCFTELLRLWLEYRFGFPVLDDVFPQWLTDFAILYKITDAAMGRLTDHADKCANVFLKNLFLHKYYIEEDHGIEFPHISLFISETLARSRFYRSPHVSFCEKQFGAAVNGIDQYLRKQFGKNIFEFFYPPYSTPLTIRAFKDLPGVGESYYSGEWIDFIHYRPLKEFLRNVFLYVEYRLRLQTSFDKPLKKPRLESIWIYVIHNTLHIPGKIKGDETLPPEQTVKLNPHAINRLRSESDDVRDMLRVDGDEEREDAFRFTSSADSEARDRPLTPFFFDPLSGGGTSPVKDYAAGKSAGPDIPRFITELDEAGREALRLIAHTAAGSTACAEAARAPSVKSALAELAEKNSTMPDLLIDSVNEKFQDAFKDLLIDTLDGGASIQAEYREEVYAYFEIV
ncbi:MAG: TerB N-terminal domain-containing protein [Treponema sp.]|jgi:hypothetical protein|nr:TerB N-terminal domain-containing protein [Treponema sp.]